MRMALPFAATRVSTFSRVLGSRAQTALNVTPHAAQVCSRPIESSGTDMVAPQAQRTVPALAPESLFSSPMP